MQELRYKNHLIKLASAYSFLIILLICIPAYFYMQSEIKNYKINEMNHLEQHSLNIQRAIYDFNVSKESIFRIPKSFSINTNLYDLNKNLIFSTSNNLTYSRSLKKLVALEDNRLGAKELEVIKELNLKEIYLKITILTLCVGLFIFISAYLILKQSILPYKKANDYLDRFFNDAMHEIKTPLGVLQLNLELLNEKIDESKELTRSLNAVKNLWITYEDIEYLIKQKRVKYQKEKLILSNFLKQRIELFESLANSKNITFELDIEENLMIEINRIELQRIIDNTLSNAIKYSNESSKVIVNLKQDDSIILSIEDFGKGIKEKNRIFNRYYREETIKGGFGIGLNIVKNICDKNNIQIEVYSTIKKGSKFIYKFLNIP